MPKKRRKQRNNAAFYQKNDFDYKAKTIFGSGIETKVDNHSKYNINKNKQCNISINEGEKKDERKYVK